MVTEIRSADAPERVVEERVARSTGTTVQLVDNRDGGFDDGDLPWFTVCVDHGGVCSHPTRALARSFLAEPDGWCPVCQNRCRRCFGSGVEPYPSTQRILFHGDAGSCSRCGGTGEEPS